MFQDSIVCHRLDLVGLVIVNNEITFRATQTDIGKKTQLKAAKQQPKMYSEPEKLLLPGLLFHRKGMCGAKNKN